MLKAICSEILSAQVASEGHARCPSRRSYALPIYVEIKGTMFNQRNRVVGGLKRGTSPMILYKGECWRRMQMS